ncbi:MAG: VOC family protein [Flavobacteriales bacterium]|nr:VOC family protein [Flavobacteriales bacterium]
MILHHVGYVVHDITTYANVLKLSSPLMHVNDPVQQAFIALYDQPGKAYIELVQPQNESSPTWNFLIKKGEGIHHACYECSEEQMWEYVKVQRMIKVMGPVPAVLFGGRTVYFFVSRKMKIIEFLLL